MVQYGHETATAAELQKLPPDAKVLQNAPDQDQGLSELPNIGKGKVVFEDGYYRFARPRERKGVLFCAFV